MVELILKKLLVQKFTLSFCTKCHFFFKISNLKCRWVILMAVSSIRFYKTFIGTIIDIFTFFIRKIKFFLIIYKNIFSYICHWGYFATIILTCLWFKFYCCLMTNYFPSLSISSTSTIYIVITLDPKIKISFTNNHFIIKRFILIKLFCVWNIVFYITKTTRGYNINQIRNSNNNSCSTRSHKRIKSTNSYSYTCP